MKILGLKIHEDGRAINRMNKKTKKNTVKYKYAKLTTEESNKTAQKWIGIFNRIKQESEALKKEGFFSKD